jgi:protein-S-isoprenylcysteine O-methyltransferase Ste14
MSFNSEVHTIAPAASEPSRFARFAAGQFSRVNLSHTASNLGVALLFFVALIPHAAGFGDGPANWIWIGGAALMGVLSLMRVPPVAAAINWRSVMVTAIMMLAPPLLMNNAARSRGVLALAALIVEFVGVIITQSARLYLGRKFALLPANRGIVSRGPFAFIRHPIYAGWLILSTGYLMAYPNARNLLALTLTIPFMIWRIGLEEQLLQLDAAYRAYCAATPYRLLPLIF